MDERREDRPYIVTLTARAECRVWVEAKDANEARKIAEMGDGTPHSPWTPFGGKPRTQKVERV